MRKYSKLDRSENDADDGALGTNPVDSDSEFENLKEKGSRSKISRVSITYTSYKFNQKKKNPFVYMKMLLNEII